MLSQAISLRRLRFYAQECRRGSISAETALTKNELIQFEQSFRRAALELQAAGYNAGSESHANRT